MSKRYRGSGAFARGFPGAELEGVGAAGAILGGKAPIRDSHRLRPYLDPSKAVRKPHDPFMQRIFGSAAWAAKVPIVLFTCTTTIWCMIFWYNWVPTYVFSIDTQPFDVAFTIVSFFLGFWVFGGESTVGGMLKTYDSLSGNCVHIATTVAATADPRQLDEKTTKPLREGAMELAALLRAMPYAVKHEYREASQLDARRLPLQENLIAELGKFPENDLLHGMVFMIEKRISWFKFERADDLFMSLASLKSDLGSLGQLRAYPPSHMVVNLLHNVLYLYFIALPLVLYVNWGWWTILVELINLYLVRCRSRVFYHIVLCCVVLYGKLNPTPPSSRFSVRPTSAHSWEAHSTLTCSISLVWIWAMLPTRPRNVWTCSWTRCSSAGRCEGRMHEYPGGARSGEWWCGGAGCRFDFASCNMCTALRFRKNEIARVI